MDRRKLLIAAAGCIGWSPKYLGPLAWYFADMSWLTVGAGGAISQWSDRSGNGNHATQASPSLQPILNPQSWDYRLSVGFDGHQLLASGASLVSTVSGSSKPAAILATFQAGTFVNTQKLFGWGNSGGGSAELSGTISTGQLAGFVHEDDSSNIKSSSSSFPLLGTQHVRLVWSFSGALMTTYVDGVAVQSGADGNVGACTFDKFSIGDSVRATAPTRGNMLEMVAVGYALQPSDARAYLSYSTQAFGP